MAQQIHIEELIKKAGGMYRLVLLASQRAKELAEGSPRLVAGDFRKATAAALEEIRQGKVSLSVPDEDEKSEAKSKRRIAKKGK